MALAWLAAETRNGAASGGFSPHLLGWRHSSDCRAVSRLRPPNSEGDEAKPGRVAGQRLTHIARRVIAVPRRIGLFAADRASRQAYDWAGSSAALRSIAATTPAETGLNTGNVSSLISKVPDDTSRRCRRCAGVSESRDHIGRRQEPAVCHDA